MAFPVIVFIDPGCIKINENSFFPRMIMFSGFTSLCTTPIEWSTHKAEHNYQDLSCSLLVRRPPSRSSPRLSPVHTPPKSCPALLLTNFHDLKNWDSIWQEADIPHCFLRKIQKHTGCHCFCDAQEKLPVVHFFKTDSIIFIMDCSRRLS